MYIFIFCFKSTLICFIFSKKTAILLSEQSASFENLAKTFQSQEKILEEYLQQNKNNDKEKFLLEGIKILSKSQYIRNVYLICLLFIVYFLYKFIYMFSYNSCLKLMF